MSKKYIKNFRKKYIFVFALIVIIIIGSTSVFTVFYYRSRGYKDDWAFYNYGQTINNAQGIKGVDINIRSINNLDCSKNKVTVAVADTGIDYNCEILQGRILFNDNDPLNGCDDDKNGYNDDFYGWNFYDFNNSIFEDSLYDYHGTYIATTIAKIDPNVKILPVKFLKSTIGSSEDAVSALKYAILRGAKIINCSWNFNERDEELLTLIKEHSDILFICAAGNSNINVDAEPLYPCSYALDNMINVMAIDNTGKPYKASGYGKKTVDIAAPGVDVKVIIPGNEETLISGTSVATAYVTGASSLLLSKNGSLTPKEIKSILISCATKTNELESFCAAGGFLNIAESLKFAN